MPDAIAAAVSRYVRKRGMRCCFAQCIVFCKYLRCCVGSYPV